MKKSQFFIFILIFVPQLLFSQIKYEKESRIKRNDVPAKALNFIDTCFVAKNVYWVYETNLNNKHSIEAKTKHLGEKFSIEFDTLGNIQDVELDIEFVGIPEKQRLEIIKNIEKEFSKYKFKEIQIQWLGNHKAQFELIKTRKTSENYTQNYDQVTLTAPFGFEYLWDTGDTTMSITINNPVPGTVYTCLLTSITGCVSYLSATILLPVEVNTILLAESNVYPNPTNNKFFIKIPETNNSITYTYTLYGINNQVVIENKGKGNEFEINTSNIAKGNYILIIQTSTKNKYKSKIIVN